MSIKLENNSLEARHDLWKKLLAVPENYQYTSGIKLVKKYEYATFDAEIYSQNNGPGTFQQVMITLPKKVDGKLPAVAIPFYFPEAMIGFEFDSLAELPRFSEIAMCKDLAERGFITITAEAYHLTYDRSDDASKDDFSRWKRAGQALLDTYPEWCGCGKLHADTVLLLDVLENDERVDSSRIGIAGHSLGGKMAFYTGCLDKRVKAIMASDFGINWDQTNWRDVWYWGDKVAELDALGMEHSQLLDLADGKPFMLLAGHYDNMQSWETMTRSASYKNVPENLEIINHATGHRPPQNVLHQGYDFLIKHLMK